MWASFHTLVAIFLSKNLATLLVYPSVSSQVYLWLETCSVTCIASESLRLIPAPATTSSHHSQTHRQSALPTQATSDRPCSVWSVGCFLPFVQRDIGNFALPPMSRLPDVPTESRHQHVKSSPTVHRPICSNESFKKQGRRLGRGRDHPLKYLGGKTDEILYSKLSV